MKQGLRARGVPEGFLFLAVFVAYGHFASFGTWDFFENDAAGRGASYDSMAESFKHFDVTVDPAVITGEAFVVNGRTHMYFGPWPSMVRFVLNAVFPALQGRWSRLMVFAAGILSVIALFRIFSRALERNPLLAPADRRFWRFAGTAAFAFASPLFFLVSSSSIYHEAILWGVAGSLWALSLEGAASSIAAGIALLSRMTCGFPWLLAKLLPSRESNRSRVQSLMPILFACGIQGLVNGLRFGSPFTFADFRYYAGSSFDPKTPYLLYGSFNPWRIPDALGIYLGFDGDAFSSKFPWMRLTLQTPAAREIFGWWEPVLSLWTGSTAILLLAAVGLFRFFRKQRPPVERVLLAGFAIQVGLILSFGCISQRFLGDFLPLLVFLVLKLFEDSGMLQKSRWKAVAIALMALNGAATLLSTYAWTGEYWWGTPPERRIEVNSRIERGLW